VAFSRSNRGDRGLSADPLGSRPREVICHCLDSDQVVTIMAVILFFGLAIYIAMRR
jgi:hypothetical protein